MQTVDIYSKGEYPANALSNFYPHFFIFDDVPCACMASFLQSLKFKNPKKQRKICLLEGRTAKKKGERKFWWKWTGLVYWKGKSYRRAGSEFESLLVRAYNVLYQNGEFALALADADGKTLTHTLGDKYKQKTILTEEEFITRLNALRTTHNKDGE